MNQNKNIFLSGERPPAREYKDRLFRMVFKEKDQFLELYNALNGTAYDNPDDLTVTTLENAIYMGMRNDVSYLLYDRLACTNTRRPSTPTCRSGTCFMYRTSTQA